MQNIKNRFFYAFCVTLMALFLGAASAYASDQESRSIEVSGLKRTYEIHLPRASNNPPSLLFVFHGGGGSGAQIARSISINGLADEHNVIVVYPDGIDKHWNDGRRSTASAVDDELFVSTLIQQLSAQYAINRNQIFAAGISNGALFSQRLACDLSDKIAAVASVAGLMPVELAPACHPSQPVSVLILQGDEDPYMPINGGAGWAGPKGKGLGGHVLSAQDTLAFWAKLENCTGEYKTERGPITLHSYRQCDAQKSVGLYIIGGGGHTWPGSTQPKMILNMMKLGNISLALNANNTIMTFFLEHPKHP